MRKKKSVAERARERKKSKRKEKHIKKKSLRKTKDMRKLSANQVGQREREREKNIQSALRAGGDI